MCVYVCSLDIYITYLLKYICTYITKSVYYIAIYRTLCTTFYAGAPKPVQPCCSNK